MENRGGASWNAFNEADLLSIQGENRRSCDPASGDGGGVIGKHHCWSSSTQPCGASAGVEIIEGDKIGRGAVDTDCLQSEYDVVIGAIGRSAYIKGKLSWIRICGEAAS